jgi:PAS domain S-box-containing protein
MVKLPTVDRVISLVRKPGQALPPSAPLTPRDVRLRGAFENAPVGIALASMHGAWLETNERFRDLVGYTRDELSRMTFATLTHPDDARSEERLMRRLIVRDVPSYRIEKRIMSKKGRYRELEVVCSLAGSDDAPFLVYIVDERSGKSEEQAQVEAQAQARSAARNAEQFLLAVIDQLADIAIIRTDDKGLIAGWNAGAERILGYGRDEILGRPRRMLYRDNEGWAGVSTQQLNAAAASGRLDLEDWRVRKDGSEVWVRTSITAAGEARPYRGIASRRR